MQPRLDTPPRAGELQAVRGLRAGDGAIRLLRRGAGAVQVWLKARIATSSRGRTQRRIFLGPRAQAILKPWLRADPSEYLFQPREAMEEHHAGRKWGRKTPLTPSQRARTRVAEPRRAPGERYDSRAYARA